MSKILELLRYSKEKDLAKKDRVENDPQNIPSENFDSGTKEKLANTYLFSPQTSSDRITKKQGAEAAGKHNSGSFMHLFPWLIAFLAVILLLINIAYRGKININIEFLENEAPLVAGNEASTDRSFKKESAPVEAETYISPISTSFVTGGHLNNYLIKRFGFYGAASGHSKILQDGFYLFNDGTAGWASAGIDFIEPLDFSETTLDFFIKGETGGESFKLILRDVKSTSYMPQAHNLIFDKNMGTEWQFISIPFTSFNGVYNPKKIKHIGFEFGTLTASNEPGTAIQIKKIKIVKNIFNP